MSLTMEKDNGVEKPTEQKKTKRGWGHNRFEIHAFTEAHRIDINYPAKNDMEKHSLSHLILQLENTLAKLKMVEAEEQKAKEIVGEAAKL